MGIVHEILYLSASPSNEMKCKEMNPLYSHFYPQKRGGEIKLGFLSDSSTFYQIAYSAFPGVEQGKTSRNLASIQKAPPTPLKS